MIEDKETIFDLDTSLIAIQNSYNEEEDTDTEEDEEDE